MYFKPAARRFRAESSNFTSVDRRLAVEVAGDYLVADEGCDSNSLRSWPIERGTTPVIPSKSNRKQHIGHDRQIYRQRNVVERMFCRVKDWRRVATRFDRNIKTFMATIAIAALVT